MVADLLDQSPTTPEVAALLATAWLHKPRLHAAWRHQRGAARRHRARNGVAVTALSGGVFDTGITDDDGAELRQLVDDIGRRSFDAKLGRRRVPEQFDADLWRNLEDTGLTRLTSTPDLGAGPQELAIVLYGVARHAGAVPLAETDAMAAWLAQQASVELPDGPLTVAIADAEPAGGRVAGTAVDVPWTRASSAVLAGRARWRRTAGRGARCRQRDRRGGP